MQINASAGFQRKFYNATGMPTHLDSSSLTALDLISSDWSLCCPVSTGHSRHPSPTAFFQSLFLTLFSRSLTYFRSRRDLESKALCLVSRQNRQRNRQLGGPATQCYNSTKWFQVLQCITNDSIKHQSFVYTYLKDKTVSFQTIPFIMRFVFTVYMSNSSNYHIDRTLTGATTPSQCGLANDSNEEVLRFPRSSRILVIRLFCVISKVHVVVGVLSLCRDAVGVFYSPSQLCTQVFVLLSFRVYIALPCLLVLFSICLPILFFLCK